VRRQLGDRTRSRLSVTAANCARRRIWFCESRPGLKEGRLDLLGHGLILRLPAVADDPDDTTVKRRGKQALTLPDLCAPHFRTEGDWAGEQHLISSSFTEELASGQIEEACPMEWHRTISYMHGTCRYMSELKCLGPSNAIKWTKLATNDFPYEFRARPQPSSYRLR
jgi:hypothetical protein